MSVYRTARPIAVKYEEPPAAGDPFVRGLDLAAALLAATAPLAATALTILTASLLGG